MYLLQSYSAGVALSPAVHAAMPRDGFGCQDLVRGCYWHLVGRGQRCCSTACDTEDSNPQRRIISPKMLIELRLKIADLVHEVRVPNIVVISQKRRSEAWRTCNFPYRRLSASDRCATVAAAFWSRRVYCVFKRNSYRPPNQKSWGASWQKDGEE